MTATNINYIPCLTRSGRFHLPFTRGSIWLFKVDDHTIHTPVQWLLRGKNNPSTPKYMFGLAHVYISRRTARFRLSVGRRAGGEQRDNRHPAGTAQTRAVGHPGGVPARVAAGRAHDVRRRDLSVHADGLEYRLVGHTADRLCRASAARLVLRRWPTSQRH